MTEIPGLEELRKALVGASSMDALDATYTFLLGLGVDYPALRPLYNIMAAVGDHERGKPHPLLAVAKRPGNRAHVADDQFKAATAAAMTMLQKAGLAKKEAARTVSTRLMAAGIQVNATTVDTWHRELSSFRHADDEVVASYRLFVSKCGTDPAISAEAALMTLPTLARTKL